MNGDRNEPIEDLLCRQPLRGPSSGLDERVWSARPKGIAAWKRAAVGGALAASVAVAAGLAVALLWQNPRGSQPTEHPGPIRIEQVWSTLAANEVVIDKDAPPMRRVRQQVVRHIRWIDEQHHVQIEWNIPSEQTALVPLEYN